MRYIRGSLPSLGASLLAVAAHFPGFLVVDLSLDLLLDLFLVLLLDGPLSCLTRDAISSSALAMTAGFIDATFWLQS
jgi:hypothetical protein